MTERRFSEKEVSVIIQQASELQLENSETPNGATVEQIRQAAAELGIEPELVNRAVLQVEAQKNVPAFQFFGAPLSNRISLIVDGTVGEEGVADLMQAIRSATGRVGSSKQLGAIFEWKSSGEFPIHMALMPKDGKTYLDVTARFDSDALLCVLLPMLISIVGWIVPAAELGIAGILLWGAGQLATYLLGRRLFQKISQKRLASVRRVTDLIADFVSQTPQGSIPAPASIAETMPNTGSESLLS